MPTHVCLVLESDVVTGVLTTLQRAGRHPVAVYPTFAEVERTRVSPDVIVTGLQQFAALRENEPVAYMRLSRRSRFIVMLNSQELLDAVPSLAFADAWVFRDINAARIDDLIDLGVEGHCLMPKQFLSRLGVDQIRLALLPRLSDIELETLQLLGFGLNNRTIAGRLELSEATIKSMVRNVLWKLRLRNRTEAGVFAVRQQPSLDGARTLRQSRSNLLPTQGSPDGSTF